MERRFWQYSEQHVGGNLTFDKALNEDGANGWEAFAAAPLNGGWVVFLKRELDEDAAKRFAAGLAW